MKKVVVIALLISLTSPLFTVQAANLSTSLEQSEQVELSKGNKKKDRERNNKRTKKKLRKKNKQRRHWY